MDKFDIYLIGVGGQGIGLISEVILRAADHAGKNVKGVDTHGLAQRGGTVVSHIRMGERIYTPLIPEGKADMAIALERHEALRAVNLALRDGGTLIYYNTVWQPLDVRMGQTGEISEATVNDACEARSIREYSVYDEALHTARMQNMVILAHIDRHALIPGIETGHYRQAMEDLMAGAMLEQNMALFESHIGSPETEA